jgi:hypothetical protein
MFHRMYAVYSCGNRYLVGVSESDCLRVLRAARSVAVPSRGFAEVDTAPITVSVWDLITGNVEAHIPSHLVPDYTFVRITDPYWQQLVRDNGVLHFDGCAIVSSTGSVYIDGSLPDGTPIGFEIGNVYFDEDDEDEEVRDAPMVW